MIDMNEEIYKSIYVTTELALVLLRRYIQEGVSKSIVYDTIKQISRNLKKIARKEYEKNNYNNFKTFFRGIHKENINKIYLKMKIVINNYAIENSMTEQELETLLNEIKVQLEDTSKQEVESFIEKFL